MIANTGRFLYHLKKNLSRIIVDKLKEFHYILLQEDYDDHLVNFFTILTKIP